MLKKYEKSTNFKHRMLAMFQFFSFTGLVMILIAIIASVYSMLENGEAIKEFEHWKNHLISAISLTPNDAPTVITGLMIYIFLGSYGAANIFGWMLFAFKERNIFDQMFLVFLMIPVFSNLIALLSQLATKKIEHTDASIDENAIIEEQTRIIKLKIKKEIKESKKRSSE